MVIDDGKGQDICSEENSATASGDPSPCESVGVHVVVGTSELKRIDPALPERIAELVNRAYGHHRLSRGEAEQRLAMGDAGDRANRVLHMAWRGPALVGCCSSTLQPPWTSRGCGHWGLLSVDPVAQGTGVASALVSAAEQRLLAAGCTSVQIEYEYTAGDAYSERLMSWYEGKCGFTSRSSRPRFGSEFRVCHKRLNCKTALAATRSIGSTRFIVQENLEAGEAQEKQGGTQRPSTKARCVGCTVV
eukprot:TRINITY_DN11417_c0_g1_i1.p1 TRINITY_DN11417_c0_g1~~TRINITY_DN11417_c0_g1_i1.p1  ORF type:complete len:247 (+),score=37.25 TRINITY_DN11417_c0_g1_i1:64-804(+)